MRYEKHDFLTNLNQLQKVGDKEKVKKLLMDEVGQLIVFHRGHVISALNESGVPTDKNSSDRELIKKVVDHLGDNKAFTAKVTGYIAMFNNIKSQSPQKYMNAGGDTWGADTAPKINPLDSITGAIGNIFGYAKAKQDAKAQADANRMALAQSLLANQPTAKSNTGAIVATVVVTAVLGLAIFYMWKHKGATHSAVAPTA